MSLEQFQQYLTHEKKYSAHTVGSYMRDLGQFSGYIEAEHGSIELQTLPYTIIRSWIISQMESGCSNRTINRKVASLKAYYKFLMRKGHIDTSPVSYTHLTLPTNREV